MIDDDTTSIPLDTAVQHRFLEINQIAEREANTLEELDNKKSLLAPQPLNMAERVNDPYFLEESGLATESYAQGILPAQAFPKRGGEFLNDARNDLLNRMRDQVIEELRALPRTNISKMVEQERWVMRIIENMSGLR